jgi:hypothetical protein
MDGFLWMFLPLFVAAGSALLAFFIMQARMDVAVAKEREALVEARSLLSSQKVMLEERVKATEEQTRRKSLDEFMQDFRVEERSYMRETKSMFSNKKLMVMQERLFFRNIPLSNWVEHEMLIEEGSDAQQIARNYSVFTPKSVSEQGPSGLAKLLQESVGPRQERAMSPAMGD